MAKLVFSNPEGYVMMICVLGILSLSNSVVNVALSVVGAIASLRLIFKVLEE